jgi:uncharacterized protein
MTIVAKQPAIESPCNRVCAIDPASGLCLGCGRTLSEVTHWIGYSHEERSRIMAELPARIAASHQANTNRTKKT